MVIKKYKKKDEYKKVWRNAVLLWNYKNPSGLKTGHYVVREYPKLQLIAAGYNMSKLQQPKSASRC